MGSANSDSGKFFYTGNFYSHNDLMCFGSMIAWRLRQLCDMNKSLRVAIINSGALTIAIDFAHAIDSCVEMLCWRGSNKNASRFRKLEKMEFSDTPSNTPSSIEWVFEVKDLSPPDWNSTPTNAWDVDEEDVQYVGVTLRYFVEQIDATLQMISELGRAERAAVILTGARDLAADLLFSLDSLSEDFDVAGCGIAPVSFDWPQYLESCDPKYPLIVSCEVKKWQPPNAWTHRPPPYVYDLSQKYWVWDRP